ncbi:MULTISPECIES: ATP-binding protein [unclassified Sulfitobacter]|uniref:PAS domain-containing sensor histidine kinase n=1 Tax=Sulfitobacter TaxID=60136 RepID=UPI000066AB84|nr:MULTISPECIES: ATP-binding protein [unclassified Sulfitobacter]AXI52766.1 PAS domain-containing sensor histidine kinase [Sulfitobacter sp. SK025]EAP79670.1 two-component hybrid sensor and regulator [Sulfitobacter sp. NAS-14.1]MAJ77373.1 PAS domain-containing sensor histidine kinase [Roseobacter sp.]OUT37813.1 MAG: PAS domain-containing sensor histidine kinase [Sulfitobacter sp. TMED3]
MSWNGKKRHIATGFAAGSALAGGWYAATSALLSGAPAQTVPVIGAIAIASLVPLIAANVRATPARATVDDSVAQQLRVLKMHTMVNVVDTDNLLVEVNDLLLEATGYTRQELIGKPVAMLYSKDNRTTATEIRDLLRQGKSWQGETTLRNRDGSTCVTQTTVTPLLDANGRWIGSISARTDITSTTKLIARRDTAMTLHELRDDIWIVSEDNLELRYMNLAAKARFGWSTRPKNGQTVRDMAAERGCEDVLDACLRMMDIGDTYMTFSATISGTNFEGSIKWLNKGTVDGRLLIMLHDVTERLEQERLQADFISMVSHELRSPLTSIKGSMGLLLSKAAGQLPPKAEGLLEIAHRNADRLVLIINDILDMEKISSGRLDFELETADLSELVAESLRANATAHQRFGLQIKCHGVDTPTYIETDANRIIQVLTNLMSNAAKFSKPGGTVEISVEKTPENVCVSVRDEGMGIAPEDQHKIFQRFADMANSDRATKGGTGLGLSICKAIVEGLGGTIDFVSKEGRGTTFTFTLPVKTRHSGPENDFERLENVG